MAEEEKEKKEETVEPAASGRSKKTLLMIAGGVLLLLIAIGVPTTLLIMKNSKKAAEKLEADAALKDDLKQEGWDDEEDELDEGEEAIGAIVPLQTFVVNLADDKSFLRVQIQVEFVENVVPQRFYPRVVPIRDGVIKILASRKPNELSSNTGKDSLKQEIADLINETLKRKEVKNIYFTQFVMQ